MSLTKKTCDNFWNSHTIRVFAMDKSERVLSASLCLAIACLVNTGSVLAADSDAKATGKSKEAAAAASTPSKPNESSTASSSSGSAPVAATVANFKTEEQQLRRMGEGVKRVHRAAMDLIGECTQPVEMMGEIDIIGQDVIPIMPATAEGFGTQYLPPRPKYIKLHVDQLASLIPILQDDINQLVVPENEKTSAAQPLDDLKGNIGDLAGHLGILQKMVSAEDYNQFNLTNEARGLIATSKAIEVARKKLLHEEAKLEKQEEKVEKSK